MISLTRLILITGSRSWQDPGALRQAITDQLRTWRAHPASVGWLDGGASGADSLGRYKARQLGLVLLPSEVARWTYCVPGCDPAHRRVRRGREFCPTAGHRRNQVLVDQVTRFLRLSPVHRAVCLIACHPGVSRGTDDCVQRILVAKIPRIWVPSRPGYAAPELEYHAHP